MESKHTITTKIILDTKAAEVSLASFSKKLMVLQNRTKDLTSTTKKWQQSISKVGVTSFTKLDKNLGQIGKKIKDISAMGFKFGGVLREPSEKDTVSRSRKKHHSFDSFFNLDRFSKIGNIVTGFNQAIHLLERFVNIVTGVASAVISVNSEMEDMRLGIASVYMAATNMNPENAMGVSKQVSKSIFRMAAELSGETSDFMNIYQQSLIPLLQAGADTEKVLKMTRLAGIAAYSLDPAWGMYKVGRDISQAFTRGVTSQDPIMSLILRSAGMTNTKFNQLGGSEKLSFLEKALEKWEGSSKLSKNTFSAMSTTLKDMGRLILMAGSEKAFERLKTHMRDFITFLETYELALGKALGSVFDVFLNTMNNVAKMTRLGFGVVSTLGEKAFKQDDTHADMQSYSKYSNIWGLNSQLLHPKDYGPTGILQGFEGITNLFLSLSLFTAPLMMVFTAFKNGGWVVEWFVDTLMDTGAHLWGIFSNLMAIGAGLWKLLEPVFSFIGNAIIMTWTAFLKGVNFFLYVVEQLTSALAWVLNPLTKTEIPTTESQGGFFDSLLGSLTDMFTINGGGDGRQPKIDLNVQNFSVNVQTEMNQDPNRTIQILEDVITKKLLFRSQAKTNSALAFGGF